MFASKKIAIHNVFLTFVEADEYCSLTHNSFKPFLTSKIFAFLISLHFSLTRFKSILKYPGEICSWSKDISS
ncbi:hypothetical protein CW304_08965 [Bacillus sp. UFRGS-B20]|nr:hypothetical protein CW304_08965 [Bacillus sp. UFRGS-B20]